MTAKFICSAADLADILELSEPQIFNLARSGVVVRVEKGKYDLPRSMKNYFESKLDDATGNPESLIEQRTRLTRYQADLAHIQLLTARTQNFPAALVWQWLGKLFAGLRSQLLAIPSSIAVNLPHIEKSDVLAIDDLIRDALTECGRMPIPRELEKAVDVHIHDGVKNEKSKKEKS